MVKVKGGGWVGWIVRTKAGMGNDARKGGVAANTELLAVEPTSEGLCGAGFRVWDRMEERFK